ncbi:MAG: hypothetical protein II306_06450 [Clostridia bacterium]|nr:hypothetical protein [Clostridia bacterium]
MKTEIEIKERLEWLLRAVDDEENQISTVQTQLWAQIDFITKFLGVTVNG